MMIRVLCLTIACLLAPSLAAAQTNAQPRGRLDIVGEAPSACVTFAPATISSANATLQSQGQGAAEVRITELIDPQTSLARASSINILLPITCNTAHRLVLRSGNGGLLRDGGNAQAQAGGFREFVPYQVSASWSGQNVSAGSDQVLSINVGDGAAGEASVLINVPAGGAPLVAGGYGDSVVIELRVEN
jgi:hypothetical protein